MDQHAESDGRDSPATEVEWLIVGGGLHGVHVAIRLLVGRHATPDGLRIVDPAPRLLASWRSRAAVTGMAYLRSPSMHHLDEDPYSLERFAACFPEEKGLFTVPNNRPSTRLFEAHCDALIELHGLAGAHLRDRAARIEPGEDSVTVHLKGGARIVARNLVLSVGTAESLAWPAWAPRGERRIAHIFDPAMAPLAPSTPRVAIVGGGISAAQVALNASDQGHEVTLVCRHSIRSHQYDSDPGWFGPKHMGQFHRERSLIKRRELISGARNRGSLPADVEEAFRRAIEEQRIDMRIGEVRACERSSTELLLAMKGGDPIAADRILLATGFTSSRPGGQLVDDLAEHASLPVAPCGFPVVDRALRWSPRLHVTGGLAELEIGPVARNIAGARRASDRIIEACG